MFVAAKSFLSILTWFFIQWQPTEPEWTFFMYINFSLHRSLANDWLCDSDLESNATTYDFCVRFLFYLYVYLCSWWTHTWPVILHIYHPFIWFANLIKFLIYLNSQHHFFSPPSSKSLHRKYREYNLQIPCFKTSMLLKFLPDEKLFPEFVIM
jgi:hypothetical protein